MAYNQTNPNGQATMANSEPVVIASNQSTLSTKLATDIAPTTGNITTATTTITATNLGGVGAATIQISGAYVGVNVTFEATVDGTIWVPIFAQQALSATPTMVSTTGVLTTNSTNVWNVAPLFGQQQLRVRATAWTSGSAAVIIEPSAQFSQQIVNVATMPTTTVTGTVATTQSTSPWVTREAVAATPTITQVTPATTSTTIKASNASRKAIVLYNGGTSDCYVTYGATSASTAFTFLLPSLGTTTIRGEEYSGVISGIWVATGGTSMQVTEIV